MFNLLIVEDNEHTCEQLAKLLSDAFPECRIDTAKTIEEGQALLKAAKERPYQAVILDIMLPLNEQSPKDELDHSLCMSASKLDPKPLVVHITSYGGNERVLEHIRRFHISEGMVRGFALNKFGKGTPVRESFDEEFATDLVQKLGAVLYGDYVREETSQLFSTQQAAYSRRPGRARHSGGGGSHRLSTLMRQVSENWGYLQEPERQIVKQYFVVDDQKMPVRVSLLPFSNEHGRN
jgi:CheY-like chemotaxis protein